MKLLQPLESHLANCFTIKWFVTRTICKLLKRALTRHHLYAVSPSAALRGMDSFWYGPRVRQHVTKRAINKVRLWQEYSRTHTVFWWATFLTGTCQDIKLNYSYFLSLGLYIGNVYIVEVLLCQYKLICRYHFTKASRSSQLIFDGSKYLYRVWRNKWMVE